MVLKNRGFCVHLGSSLLWPSVHDSDPSGSGRVDMLTGPVAAARAVVATGAWVKSKHDMYLIRGSVGAYALFLPIRRRI